MLEYLLYEPCRTGAGVNRKDGGLPGIKGKQARTGLRCILCGGLPYAFGNRNLSMVWNEEVWAGIRVGKKGPSRSGLDK